MKRFGFMVIALVLLFCPYAAAQPAIPQFCNRVEAGSTLDMTIANVRTTSTDRFVIASINPNIELSHAIRVIPLSDGVPSSGSASAFMDVLIQEGRALTPGFPGTVGLFERISFSEETSARGAFTLFDKVMQFRSGMVR